VIAPAHQTSCIPPPKRPTVMIPSKLEQPAGDRRCIIKTVLTHHFRHPLRTRIGHGSSTSDNPACPIVTYPDCDIGNPSFKTWACNAAGRIERGHRPIGNERHLTVMALPQIRRHAAGTGDA